MRGTLLTALVPRRRRRLRLLLLGWLLLNAAPFFLVAQYREVLFQHNIFGRVMPINAALCALPYILLAEAAFFSAVFGAFKGGLLSSRSRKGRVGWAVLLAASYVAAAAWLTAVPMSWILFPKSLSFLGAGDLIELLSALDRNNLVRVAAPGDLARGAGLLLLGFGGALLFVLVSPPRTGRRQVTRAFFQAIVLAFFALGIGIGTRVLLTKDELAVRRPVLENFVAPRLKLGWARVLYGSTPGEHVEDTPLSLEPAYSVDEYGRRAGGGTGKNVLLIVVEALRADVIGATHQGREITPRLNALAKSASHFSPAYALSSETGYSQASILTGQYPLRSVARDLHQSLDFPYALIYDLLSAAGYRTAYLTFEWDSTKRLTASKRLDLYLDPQYDLHERYLSLLPERYRSIETPYDLPTAELDAANVKLLTQWIEEGEGRPFFAGFYLYSPHFPYDYASVMGPPIFKPLGLSDAPSFFGYPRELDSVMKNRYFQTVNYADALIGRILDFLEERGELDSTAVIITGDHGELFGEHGAVTHGGPLYEEVLRVPLIIADASRALLPGTRPVSHVDIAPTILDLLGLPPYGGHQGRSLSRDAAPPIFASVQAAVYEDAVIDWPWKLVRSFRGKEPQLFNLSDGAGRNLFREKPKRAASLSRLLDEYRRRQLSYYLGDPERRKNHFPPPPPAGAEKHRSPVAHPASNQTAAPAPTD